MKKFFKKLICAAAGACGAAGIVKLAAELQLTDVIHYDLYFDRNFPAAILLFAAAAGAAGGFLTAERYQKFLFPLFLLLPGLIFPETFAFAILAVLAAGAAGFLAGKTLPVPEYLFKKNWSMIFIAVLFFCSFYAGYLYQVKAFYSWHFLYTDWAEYFEYYLRGRLTASSCGHWNLFPTFAGHFLIRLLPAPETLFALNALLIASGIPLAANLAVVCGLKWRGAVFFAFITALLPVFTHQYLCSFYGYHPVVWLIPAGLLFFTFEAKGSQRGMFICAAAMLLVQETAAMLWVGWGLYKMTEKKKFFHGLIIFLIGAGLFWLLSGLSDTSSSYGQAGRYHHLGTSLIEIALSPFLRPAAFWNTVLEKHTICFLLVLLIPAGLAVFPRWKLLLVTLPNFAGILLQSYSSSKTVASQYGLEITVLLLGLAISSTGLIKQKKIPLPSCFKISRFRYVPAILTALLFSTAAAHLLWGQSFIAGKWSFKGSDVPVGNKIIRRVGNQPDMQKVYENLCQNIPADARLLASSRVRSRFVCRNRTFPLDTQRQPGDVIVVDTDDIFPNTGFRKNLYFSNDVHLINSINYRGIRLLVYLVSPPGVAKMPLPFLRTADRNAGYSGMKITEDKHFDIRLMRMNDRAVLTARVKTPPASEADFIIRMSGAAENFIKVRFAYGALPSPYANPEQVFLLPLPGPEFQHISVSIKYL